MDLYEPAILSHAVIDGCAVWHYLLQTTIGDLHIVQHEVNGEKNILDDYIGWHDDHAKTAYHRRLTRMIRGKE